MDLARLFVWLALAANISGQVTLSVDSAAGNPGSVTTSTVSMAPSAQTVAALQFDLVWTAPGLDIALASATQANKNLYSLRMSDGAWRVILADLNQDTIPAGPILNLTITLDAGLNSPSVPIRILNAAAVDPDGTAVGVETSDGAVTVTGPPAVVVVNGATYLAGPVVANEVVAILVPPEITAGPVSVLFDGVAAPVLYTGAGQINTVVPGRIGGSITKLSVAAGPSKLTAALSVAPAAPGLFTSSGTGAGQAAAMNADGSANSSANPAPSGSALLLFATGVLAANLQIQIGGQTAQVLAISTVPRTSSGVVQISVLVPDGLGDDPAAAVALTQFGITSPAGTTVAVQ